MSEENKSTIDLSKETDSFAEGRRAAMDEKTTGTAYSTYDRPEDTGTYSAAASQADGSGGSFASQTSGFSGGYDSGSAAAHSDGYGDSTAGYGDSTAGYQNSPYGDNPYGNPGGQGSVYNSTTSSDQGSYSGQPYGGYPSGGYVGGQQGNGSFQYGGAQNGGAQNGSYNYNGQNYDSGGGRQKKEGNGFGIASLVLGILSIFCFATCINFPMAIVAIILGIVQIVSYRSRGLAIGGIVTGAISIIIGIVFWAAIIPAYQSTIESPEFREYIESIYGEDAANDILDIYGGDGGL